MISEERKKVLDKLTKHIQCNIDLEKELRLNFICTHNSRRSHLAQVWAHIASRKYGFEQIQCYSGGTEATAVYPMIIETLRNDGLEVIKIGEGNNPIYILKVDRNAIPLVLFSKEYDHPFNPKDGFTAVMTCNDADENCPFIPGAEERIALTYADPKSSDGSAQQREVYRERSMQIKEEMDYVFSMINA